MAVAMVVLMFLWTNLFVAKADIITLASSTTATAATDTTIPTTTNFRSRKMRSLFAKMGRRDELYHHFDDSSTTRRTNEDVERRRQPVSSKLNGKTRQHRSSSTLFQTLVYGADNDGNSETSTPQPRNHYRKLAEAMTNTRSLSQKKPFENDTNGDMPTQRSRHHHRRGLKNDIVGHSINNGQRNDTTNRHNRISNHRHGHLKTTTKDNTLSQKDKKKKLPSSSSFHHPSWAELVATSELNMDKFSLKSFQHQHQYDRVNQSNNIKKLSTTSKNQSTTAAAASSKSSIPLIPSNSKTRSAAVKESSRGGKQKKKFKRNRFLTSSKNKNSDENKVHLSTKTDGHYVRDRRELQTTSSVGYTQCLDDLNLFYTDEYCSCDDEAGSSSLSSGTTILRQSSTSVNSDDTILICSNTNCELCDTVDTSICGIDTTKEIYDSTTGQVTGSGFQFTYNPGTYSYNSFELYNLDCDDGSNNLKCNECLILIDSVPCTSCEYQTCDSDDNGGLSFESMKFDCSNIVGSDGVQQPPTGTSGNGVYDFCIENFIVPIGDPLYMMSDDSGFFECNTQGLRTCNERINLQAGTPGESQAPSVVACNCESTIFGEVVMSCSTNCGIYCNNENTICGVKQTDIVFDEKTGDELQTKEIFQYTIGRSESIEYTIYNFDDSCSFRVDFQSCNCKMKTCGATGDSGSVPAVVRAPLVDCSDITLIDTPEDDFDPIIDFCTVGSSLSIDTGVFEFLSLGEFTTCIDNSPVNDVCDGATPVDIMDGTVIFGDLGAALSSPSSPNSCASFSGDKGLWFSVVGQG